MIKSTAKLISKTQANKQWLRIGIKDHHGIAVFLPGLKTRQSFGIGGYLDLLPLIDWCSNVGFDVIQLLPLNDNGDDKSPYNAISAFALNPLLLSLHPFASHLPDSELRILKKMNRNKRISYTRLTPIKTRLMQSYCTDVKKIMLQDSTYHQFIKENNHWLDAYALFKAEGKQKEVHLHKILQYLCHNQMTFVKTYAEEKGILLKGDIPILVSPDSVDVKMHPEMFDKTLTAGAPPDQYAKGGQSWGFPIYRWDDSFTTIIHWWTERLNHASKYYHLYRLDHVVGLFRIWAIPAGKRAAQGHFRPSLQRDWLPRGKKILKCFLKSCPMLPIAEDLGCIPDPVRACLSDLGIPGTKVIRWELGVSPKKYTPISMTTLSTHDVETTVEWWKKYPEDIFKYCLERGWRYTKLLSKDRAFKILKESHESASLFHINLLQEYLHLIPELSWQNPKDDRINIPATNNRHNWSYKYRCSIEEITANKALQHLIKKVLKK